MVSGLPSRGDSTSPLSCHHTPPEIELPHNQTVHSPTHKACGMYVINWARKEHWYSVLNWPGQAPSAPISTQHTCTRHRYSNMGNIQIHPPTQYIRYLPSHPGMKTVSHIFPLLKLTHQYLRYHPSHHDHQE
uniref:Uncharacterized protein n=1 Tax=Arundo donax TaxID=35708 RepID=A0A0A9GXT6_ARUDO